MVKAGDSCHRDNCGGEFKDKGLDFIECDECGYKTIPNKRVEAKENEVPWDI